MTLDKIADEALGIPAKVAMDFAQRCDALADHLEKTAASWSEKDGKWTMTGKGETITPAQIQEIKGPGIPLYILRFILNDGTAMKDRKNYKKLADAQKAATKWVQSDEQGASLVFQDFSREK